MQFAPRVTKRSSGGRALPPAPMANCGGGRLGGASHHPLDPGAGTSGTASQPVGGSQNYQEVGFDYGTNTGRGQFHGARGGSNGSGRGYQGQNYGYPPKQVLHQGQQWKNHGYNDGYGEFHGGFQAGGPPPGFYGNFLPGSGGGDYYGGGNAYGNNYRQKRPRGGGNGGQGAERPRTNMAMEETEGR